MYKNNDFSDCPDYLSDFLLYLMTIAGRSPRTVDGYYVDLRLFLRYLKASKNDLQTLSLSELKTLEFNDVPIELIQNISISQIYAYLTYTLNSRLNTAVTRSRKVSSLRSLFKYLHTKTILLPHNPLENLELPSIKKSIPKYLTLEESISLLSSVKNNKTEFIYRNYCILTLFLNCGMRLSELVNIKLSDIRENTVTLLGKGDKERVIYLNQACQKSISDYITLERPNPYSNIEEQFLFLNRVGKPFTPRRIEQIVAECLEQANLGENGYSPHKLRHTAATLLYQHGNVDIRALKEILGHTNIATTEIYTHISSKQLEKAANASPLALITSDEQL